MKATNQAIKKSNNLTTIILDGKHIKSDDTKLSFGRDISKLCNESKDQLNTGTGLSNFLGSEEKKVLIYSLIYANFNCCTLVWSFFFFR